MKFTEPFSVSCNCLFFFLFFIIRVKKGLIFPGHQLRLWIWTSGEKVHEDRHDGFKVTHGCEKNEEGLREQDEPMKKIAVAKAIV